MNTRTSLFVIVAATAVGIGLAVFFLLPAAPAPAEKTLPGTSIAATPPASSSTPMVDASRPIKPSIPLPVPLTPPPPPPHTELDQPIRVPQASPAQQSN